MNFQRSAPSIDICHNFRGTYFPMHPNQVLFKPRYEVVLERALDNLVKEVGCQQCVNVRSWETSGKWLKC